MSMSRMSRRCVGAGVVIAAVVLLGGCTTWSRPAADLSQFRRALPAAPISAGMFNPSLVASGVSTSGIAADQPVQVLAFARVQYPGVKVRSDDRYSAGVYDTTSTANLTLVADDLGAVVDLAERMERSSGLQVRPVATGTAQRLAHTPDSIIAAAREMNADWLLVYTLDTELTDKTHGWGLSLLTLGLIPNRTASMRATAVASVMDLRTSQVLAEWMFNDDGWQPANGYTADDACEQVTKRTEGRLERTLAERVGELRRERAPRPEDGQSRKGQPRRDPTSD